MHVRLAHSVSTRRVWLGRTQRALVVAADDALELLGEAPAVVVAERAAERLGDGPWVLGNVRRALRVLIERGQIAEREGWIVGVDPATLCVARRRAR